MTSTLFGRDHDDVAVLDLHHGPRLLEEGGNRRGEEGLVLADADDQRALLASADEQVGMLGVHGDERVVAAKIGEGGANGGGEIALVVALDQVGDDLGVGLGAEDVALVAELAAQLRVVLDDPVEDDVDVVGAVAVRVGVLLGDAAVGCPARMREADRRLRLGDGDGAAVRGGLLDGGAQVREVADRADGLDVPVIEQGDAGGVVAAVLELLEARDQQVATRPLAHVSDDAAHRRNTSSWGRSIAADRRGPGTRRLETAARRSAAGASSEAQPSAALGGRDQPPEHRLALRLVRPLDHHPDQRLGAGRPDENAAAALEPGPLAADRLPQGGRAGERLARWDPHVLQVLRELA